MRARVDVHVAVLAQDFQFSGFYLDSCPPLLLQRQIEFHESIKSFGLRGDITIFNIPLFFVGSLNKTGSSFELECLAKLTQDHAAMELAKIASANIPVCWFLLDFHCIFNLFICLFIFETILTILRSTVVVCSIEFFCKCENTFSDGF